MLCPQCLEDKDKFCRGICLKCYGHIYYKKNKTKLVERYHRRYLANREVELQKNKEWYALNKERALFLAKRWVANNRSHLNECRVLAYKANPNIKLRVVLRDGVRRALIDKKHNSTMDIVGCSVEEFRQHIESKFEPGMNWGNWGFQDRSDKVWQLDHIQALCRFNLADPEQAKLACHYTNFQPLWLNEHKNKTTQDRKEILMNASFEGKVKDSLCWWLGKRRPFNLDDRWQIQLLSVNTEGKCARIKITKLVDGKPVLKESSEAEIAMSEVTHDAN